MWTFHFLSSHDSFSFSLWILFTLWNRHWFLSRIHFLLQPYLTRVSRGVQVACTFGGNLIPRPSSNWNGFQSKGVNGATHLERSHHHGSHLDHNCSQDQAYSKGFKIHSNIQHLFNFVIYIRRVLQSNRTNRISIYLSIICPSSSIISLSTTYVCVYVLSIYWEIHFKELAHVIVEAW